MLGVFVCWRAPVRVTSRSCTAAAATAAATAAASTAAAAPVSTKLFWGACIFP